MTTVHATSYGCFQLSPSRELLIMGFLPNEGGRKAEEFIRKPHTQWPRNHISLIILWYCWWKKSCTNWYGKSTWDVKNPVNNGAKLPTSTGGCRISSIKLYLPTCFPKVPRSSSSWAVPPSEAVDNVHESRTCYVSADMPFLSEATNIRTSPIRSQLILAIPAAAKCFVGKLRPHPSALTPL